MDSTTYRLLLIEPEDHLEVLRRWLPCFSADPRARVDLWIPQRHQQAVAALPRAQRLYTLSGGAPPLDGYDLIILLTVDGQPGRWLDVLRRRRYWLVCHNVNRWRGRPIYSFGPRNLVRYLRARRQRPALLRLAAGAQYLICPVEAMRQHLLDWRPDLPVVSLPFACTPEAGMAAPPPIPQRILVPGRIDARLRDYELLSDWLRGWARLNPRLQVDLAGRLISREVPRRLQARLPSLDIRWQPGGYSQADFDRTLAACDWVAAPLRQYVRTGPYREEMGRSKISGALFDAVSAGKPIRLPDWYTD